MCLLTFLKFCLLLLTAWPKIFWKLKKIKKIFVQKLFRHMAVNILSVCDVRPWHKIAKKFFPHLLRNKYVKKLLWSISPLYGLHIGRKHFELDATHYLKKMKKLSVRPWYLPDFAWNLPKSRTDTVSVRDKFTPFCTNLEKSLDFLKTFLPQICGNCVPWY